jgi:hypothetical protein
MAASIRRAVGKFACVEIFGRQTELVRVAYEFSFAGKSLNFGCTFLTFLSHATQDYMPLSCVKQKCASNNLPTQSWYCWHTKPAKEHFLFYVFSTKLK